MFRRFMALFAARNKEFYRDRAGLGWNIMFPFLIIVGFAVIFGRGGTQPVKVGIHGPAGSCPMVSQSEALDPVPFDSLDQALAALSRHRVDLVVDCGGQPPQYWVEPTSPRGRVAEGLFFMAAADPAMVSNTATAHTVQGAGTGYIDWLFPGILGMNMMFSALFGVGYMVVLYRKNGVLRRFAATPLTPFEFLASQVASRLVVIVVSTAFVFVACLVLFGFSNQGNYLSLIVFASLGACSHIALALLIAARSSSEEFASGLLNIIAWPMMFLSEVWFSLEGAPPWVQKVSAALPLTHLVGGMRAILNEGASLFSLGPSVAVLVGYTAFFMAVGSALFRWTKA